MLKTFARPLAALAVALVATMGLAGVASADTYAPESGNATVSATVVTSGKPATVGGSGFCVGSSVTATLTRNGTIVDTQVKTATNGSVSFTFTPTQTGNYKVTLKGKGTNCNAPRALGTRFTVRSAAAGGANGPGGVQGNASGLPHTGADLTTLWAGLGLLVAGGLLVSVARSRRRVLA